MIRRILVPLDGTDAAGAVMPTVRHLVGGTGSVVYLLGVSPLPRPAAGGSIWSLHHESAITATVLGVADGVADRSLSFDHTLVREHAGLDRYLARHGSQLAYDGIVVRRDVRFGDPRREILAAARRHAVHLIVLAPQSESWWQRLRRPSLTQQLIRSSPVPVLVAPSERVAA